MSARESVPFEADMTILPTRETDDQRRVQSRVLVSYADDPRLPSADSYLEDLMITRYYHDISTAERRTTPEHRATIRKIGGGVLAGLPVEIMYDRSATIYHDEFDRHVGPEIRRALHPLREVRFLPKHGLTIHTVVSPETVDRLRRDASKRRR